MRKIFLLFILFLVFPYIFSQKANYFKKIFIDAEYFVLFKEYNEALPLYLEIYNYQQDNLNIAYRIGECYIHISGDKQKALPYLEKAVKSVSNDYKIGYFAEKNAPAEAYYLLGIAYRINNQLNKAVEMFNMYRRILSAVDIDKKHEADYQIEVCNNAKEMMKNPIKFTEINLGNNINTSFSNMNPVVTENDSLIIYISKLRFYDAVFSSRWKDGKWQISSNLTPYFGSDGDLNTCSLSHDGKTLYLSRYDWDNYNIYLSHYENNIWSNIEKLDRKINTIKYNETHACITSDGGKIYFVSDQIGGIGEKDIYYITQDELGNWNDPVNLGPEINTSLNEETPFITENGILYFSSEGHYNIGGYDIFYSEFKNNRWTKPKNIGYPINSTDDDLHFMPIQNGKVAYYSLFRRDGYGSYDIYRIEF